MPKSAPLQSVFHGGEISPYAQGRVELPMYKKSLATCLNAIPTIQGNWTRRPGSKFLGTTFSSGFSSGVSRLIPFAPAFGLNCMIEFCAGRFRFWQNYALIGGSISHSYSPADIASVKYVQNGNYIYFFHPNYTPFYLADITGLGYPSGSGKSGSVVFQDGPYLEDNSFLNNGTTLVLSSNTPGTGITVTANNGIVGINGGVGFSSDDIGRHIRLNPTSTGPGTGLWCWGIITGVNNSGQVVITLVGPNPTAITEGTTWRLGAFKNVPGGQPGCATIDQGRLWVGGSKLYPRRIDGSNLNHDISFVDPSGPAFVWYSPTEYIKGVVTDADAVSFTLFSKDAQDTAWMQSDERGILLGSTGDEWTIRPDTLSGAITPTNVDAKAVTFYGSNPNVAPCKVGKAIVFVQRSSLKVREMSFAFDINGYRAPDRTLFAEHITGESGIVEMAHQREPQSIVWAVRADGTICAMTHEEEDGEITTGWHRHALGSNQTSAFAGAHTVVSVATLPSNDTTKDEVWVIVDRLKPRPGFPGLYSAIQTVEVLQSVSNQYVSDADAWYLDCAVQVTNGSPSTVLTGLAYLAEQMVTVWADGAPYGSFVVTDAGTITLPVAVTTAIVGFDYNSDGQMLRLEAGSADGAALGKIRRAHRVGFYLQQTLGLQIGMSFDDLTALTFRTQDTPPSVAQPSFSGIRVETIDADYDTENQITWRVNGGAPCTILAIAPRMDTQDAE